MSSNGQQPKLKLSGCKKHFGSKVVLDGIDLSNRAGQIACRYRRIGTGKSVMLKCVLGLLETRRRFDHGRRRGNNACTRQ
jgi:ABC-type transporter Mla maintaining outer membrane lipid asymmetry ATPase subunit MlaF